MIKYFVWEQTPIGPVAAIWHGKLTDGNGKDKPTIGSPIRLPDGDKRSIDDLKLVYPHEQA